MNSQLKQKVESKKNIVRIPLDDNQLYERMVTRRSKDPDKSGDQRYPGKNGLWGEWVASNNRWTDNRWFVSAICGHPKSKRMSLHKAYLLRDLRFEKI